MHVRRPELVLAGAVAICLPMVPGVLSGNVTVIAAGTRFLVAIVICWVGGSLLTSVFDRYSAEARRTQALKMLAAARHHRTGDAARARPPGDAPSNEVDR
jgi:hypothetical protein